MAGKIKKAAKPKARTAASKTPRKTKKAGRPRKD